MPYVNHSLTISQSVILTISNWYSFIFAINSIHQQQFLTISGWYSQWAYQTLRNWYETRLINIITLEWWLWAQPPWYRKPPYSPYYPTILTHIILLLLVIPILSMDVVVVVASLIFTINHQNPTSATTPRCSSWYSAPPIAIGAYAAPVRRRTRRSLRSSTSPWANNQQFTVGLEYVSYMV